MKKTYSQLGALSVLFALIFSFSSVSAAVFPDVGSGHNNEDAVDYVFEHGIVSGYPDGNFRPEITINRAEFTKIIVGAVFEDSQIFGSSCFPDVKHEWFAKYVCTAKREGLIDGYPDGYFRPGNSVVFAEASKIVVNGFGYNVSQSSIWYEPFVSKLSEKKAIPTSLTAVSNILTRGEMAEMIYRLRANINNKNSLVYASGHLTREGAENDSSDSNQMETKTLAENIDDVLDDLAGVSPLSDYNMAFVILAEDESDITNAQLNRLDQIKALFEPAFRVATKGLATMGTSEDIFIMELNDNLLDDYYAGSEDIYLSFQELLKEFYRFNDDKYDFVTFYTTFDTPHDMHHAVVQNNIMGIGHDVYDASDVYGANRGRLLGYNFMRKLEVEMFEPGDYGRIGGLLHETGHQWCCYVGEDFDGANAELGIRQQGIHFYIGLDSPDSSATPLGAKQWVLNNNGSYEQASLKEDQPVFYHPIQLYFMGLLDEDFYDDSFTVYDVGVPPNYDYDNVAPIYTISVDNIIRVEGRREVVR